MNYSYKKRKTADYFLMVLVFALIAFGLIMIYSVSKYLSLQITNQVSDKYFLTRQLVSLGDGLVVWIAFQSIDYKFLQKHTSTMLWATIILPAVVLATSVPVAVAPSTTFVIVFPLSMTQASACHAASDAV